MRSVLCVPAFVCLKVASAAPVRISWKAIEPAEAEGDEQQTIVSCICWVCIFRSRIEAVMILDRVDLKAGRGLGVMLSQIRAVQTRLTPTLWKFERCLSCQKILTLVRENCFSFDFLTLTGAGPSESVMPRLEDRISAKTLASICDRIEVR